MSRRLGSAARTATERPRGGRDRKQRVWKTGQKDGHLLTADKDFKERSGTPDNEKNGGFPRRDDVLVTSF